MTDKFRVLSLDGGGVRGILTAKLLLNIENNLNEEHGKNLPIGDWFDLIVGTSTGGLIALSAAVGKPAAEIFDLYETLIPEIFGDLSKRSRFKSVFMPKYKNDRLKIATQAFFEETTLNDVTTDVCITSLSLQNAAPRLHKSSYNKNNAGRLGTKLSDIALFTSAAPTYFEASSDEDNDNLVDGGLFANNPCMVALVEALQFDRPSKKGNTPLRDLSQAIDQSLIMVSVGTGQSGSMPYQSERLAKGGLLQWAKPITEAVFTSQSIAADKQAAFILGNQYCRINPQLTFAMKLDDVSKVNKLKNLADINKAEIEFLRKNF